MARKGRKDRGLFERPAGSGIYWIRYAGSDGREHMERGGSKSEAHMLYMRRRTEINDDTLKSPRERRAALLCGYQRQSQRFRPALGILVFLLERLLAVSRYSH